jgi:hypothetical protein
MGLGGNQFAPPQVEKIERLNLSIQIVMAPARPLGVGPDLCATSVCHNSTGPSRVFRQARRNAARTPWNHPGSIIPPPNCLPTIGDDRVRTRIAIKRVWFFKRGSWWVSDVADL